MKLKILIITGLVIAFSFFSSPIYSQPSNPPGGDGDGDPVGDETDIPFGIEWLLIGGVSYGLTKYKKKKKIKE